MKAKPDREVAIVNGICREGYRVCQLEVRGKERTGTMSKRPGLRSLPRRLRPCLMALGRVCLRSCDTLCLRCRYCHVSSNLYTPPPKHNDSLVKLSCIAGLARHLLLLPLRLLLFGITFISKYHRHQTHLVPGPDSIGVTAPCPSLPSSCDECVNVCESENFCLTKLRSRSAMPEYSTW